MKMSAEKLPLPLYEKTPIGEEKKKNKFCSRYIISWILATLLILLVFVLAVEFLYPVIEEKCKSDEEHFMIYDQRPIEVKVISPTLDHSRNASKDKVKGKGDDETFWNVGFSINPKDLCSKVNPVDSKEDMVEDTQVKLLVIVPSATNHFTQRLNLRNAWCSITQIKPQDSLRLAFITRQTSNKTEQELAQKESEKYGDVIQVNHQDNDHEFTGSTVSRYMMAWMSKHCAQTQYFLKANDDSFLNVELISRFLDGEPFVSEGKFTGGFGFSLMGPFKKPNEDLYALYEDYSEVEPPPVSFGATFISKGPIASGVFPGQQDGQTGVSPLMTGVFAQDIEVTFLQEPKFRGKSTESPNGGWKQFGNSFPIAPMPPIAPGFNPLQLQQVLDEMTKTLIQQILKSEEKTTITNTPLPLI